MGVTNKQLAADADNKILDERVLVQIRDFGRCHLSSITTELFGKGLGRDEFVTCERKVDRSLQRLRRNGVVRFDKSARYWKMKKQTEGDGR